MTELSIEQIRYFRLHSHHLDTFYQKEEIPELAGACGMQNSPPGAWETALHNRVPDCSVADMEHLLSREKTLLQAWSFRGAPVVFPTSESDIFLSALAAEGDESWIYTSGILLALDFLKMTFDELFELLEQVIQGLDGTVIAGKNALDQTLAQWMTPLLPRSKQGLWNQPSMYGSPDKQTVGGAVVSFLLRPCAFKGFVVFGERNGITPSFTSFKSWSGRPLAVRENAVQTLVRKYLHCYGPAAVDSFAAWLGCSGKQARRMWSTVAEEIEPVKVLGKKAFLLSEDKKQMYASDSPDREILLLGGHDPFLDQRDRMVLQPDKSLHRQIWRTVTNPGAVLYCGEIIGIWTSKKKGRGMELKISLWQKSQERQALQTMAEEYAAFRKQELTGLEILPV